MSATHHRTRSHDADAPPPIAADLVRRFGDHIDAYKSGRYNETQLRREFIDPLFRELGWDVDNEQGHAEAYKDVIHEAAVEIEGAVKAPDYSFRIGGVRKFFLEAKKPSINIKGDPGPAYQLRRYAWSAKLPLSILTDFEEFAVYDCRTRPVKTDSPATARVLYLKYTDYLTRWGEIASIFSREAILTGSFDKYVESKKRKRGTAEVDAAFLQEIEAWRETLARNLALRNAALTQRQLNFAVQVTVDRIIFLRMCEDRGIEDYARLMTLLNGDRIYDRLMQLFREADQRYNSGLFHFQREPGRADPDELSPGLTIDDRILKDIIKGLYYPDSPYEFSVLPADILGHVYEQFLGKVIRLTPGHRAKVEEKPEVRKAGGVYYTPTYIVQYIVEHTVGKLLEDRSIKWIGREKKRAVNQPRLDGPLRVLDPACGSGSFLLGAYQYLLDWHLDYYTTHDPESWAKKKNPPIYLTSGTGVPPVASYRLTVAERKRILVDHIFGVDIDTQAVEVTKLSLLLKVLEGETTHPLGTHLWYEKERALPDLASNIKCGNSLIGPDFYDTSGRQMDMFDEEERYRINVFDWHGEFPHIFKRAAASPRRANPARRKTSAPSESTPAYSPGFDAVIGNPPYIFGEYHDDRTKAYLETSYDVAADQYDTYQVFAERGLQLTGEGGSFSLIVPDALLARDLGHSLRGMLLRSGLTRVYHCGLVFASAVSAVVFVAEKGKAPKKIISQVREGMSATDEHTCSRRRFQSDPRHRLLVHASDKEAHLLQRITTNSHPLGSIVHISRGEEIGTKHVHSEGAVPITVGDDITRYALNPPTRFIDKVTKHDELYESPKIVVVKTGQQCIAVIDCDDRVTMQSVYNLHCSDDSVALERILGILNSRFVRFFIYKTFTAYKLLFPQLNQTTVQSIPIPRGDARSWKPLCSRVTTMLDLHKQLAAAKTAHEKTALQRQIDATDRQIDRLVYDLYGLTDDEIRMIEDATQ